MSVSSIGERVDLHSLLDDRTAEILERRRGSPVKRRGWLVRRALLAADLAGLTLAFLVAQQIYTVNTAGASHIDLLTEVLLFVATLPGWVLVAKLYGLYDKDEERTNHSTTDDFFGVFHLVTICTFLLSAASHLTGWANPQLSKLLVFWLLAIMSVTLARATSRSLCRRSVHYLQNTVIVGAGGVGQTVARKLLKHPEYGSNLVGFIDSEPKERQGGLEHLTLLGDAEALPDIVKLLDIERVIIAFSNDRDQQTLDLMRKLNELDVQVDIVPRFFEVVSPGVDVHTVEGIPMLGLPPTKLSRSSRAIKRTVDLIASALGLLVLAPVFLVIAVLIKRDSPGPVFFRQVRMGEGDEVFRIWKFRTMTVDADERKHEFEHLNKHLAPGGDPRMFKIDHDPRVTRAGAFLRRASLDELPQLFNVFLGEMSVVGPRPLILDEHRHVGSKWAVRRLSLKPGITGLWQVLGRDEIGFDEMVKLDYLYVTSWSLLQDLSLVARTVPALFRT